MQRGRKRTQKSAFAEEDNVDYDDEYQAPSDKDKEENNSDSDFDPDAPPKKRQRQNAANKKSTKNSSKSKSKTKSKSKAKSNKQKKIPKLAQKSINSVKKILNNHVKTLAKMVNLNWHDGYEEQGEELGSWYSSLQLGVNIIDEYCLNVSNDDLDMITFDTINKCNEILIIMNDTWHNMNAIPARCDIPETLSCSDDITVELKLKNEKIKTFEHDIDGLISYLWKIVLLTAAAMGESKCDNNMLLRFIKDAHDNGVTDISNLKELVSDDNNDDASSDEDCQANENENTSNKEKRNDNEKNEEKEKGKDNNNNQGNNDEKSESDTENEETNNAEMKKKVKGTIIEKYPILFAGVSRLQNMFENHKNDWSKLSNNVKVHKMRRAIDRRFDGPKHLRTRDYSDDDFGWW